MAANVNTDINIVAQAVLHLLKKETHPTNDAAKVNAYHQTQVGVAIADLDANSANGDSLYSG
jgi:hypothetical protein